MISLLGLMKSIMNFEKDNNMTEVWIIECNKDIDQYGREFKSSSEAIEWLLNTCEPVENETVTVKLKE